MAEVRPETWVKHWYLRAAPGHRINCSPFAFRNVLLENCGEPKNVSRARDGSYTIEAWNKEQSQAISTIEWIGDTPVTIQPHRNLNSSRCVIFCPDLVQCNNEEITKELDSVGVSSTRPLGKSGVILLNFSTPTYPDKIRIGFMKYSTRQYVPNPLRCYNCNKYGHHSRRCSATKTCPKCGNPGHIRDNCTSEPFCVNCKGAHDCASKECAIFKLEKNVISIKLKENIAFPEARIWAQQASYAQVASARPHTSDNLRPPTSHRRPAPLPQLPPAKTTATIACQTDDLPMLPPLDLSCFKKPTSSTQTSTDALWPHELAQPAPKPVSSIPRPRSTQNLTAKPSAKNEQQPSRVLQPPSPSKRRTSDESKAVKRKKHRSDNASTRKTEKAWPFENLKF